MRTVFILFIATLFSFSGAKSQIFSPFGMSAYRTPEFINHMPPHDSLQKNKWSVSRFSYLSTGITFYKGGQATLFAAPLGMQLTRRLTDNLHAFGNIAVTPAFISLNPLMAPPGGKNYLSNPFPLKSNHFGLNPSVSMGLMYINDARTFSISGSISAEKNSYFLPYRKAGIISEKK